jgi:hypothetical protein
MYVVGVTKIGQFSRMNSRIVGSGWNRRSHLSAVKMSSSIFIAHPAEGPIH